MQLAWSVERLATGDSWTSASGAKNAPASAAWCRLKDGCQKINPIWVTKL